MRPAFCFYPGRSGKMEDFLVYGISVVVMVAGITNFLKKLGVKDNGSLIAAMILGPVIMVVNELSIQFPLISPWVRAVVIGLMCSLTASGLWDGAKKFLSRPAV